jgi:hypothetical protein
MNIKISKILKLAKKGMKQFLSFEETKFNLKHALLAVPAKCKLKFKFNLIFFAVQVSYYSVL